jgi:hypothetical protein
VVLLLQQRRSALSRHREPTNPSPTPRSMLRTTTGASKPEGRVRNAASGDRDSLLSQNRIENAKSKSPSATRWQVSCAAATTGTETVKKKDVSQLRRGELASSVYLVSTWETPRTGRQGVHRTEEEAEMNCNWTTVARTAPNELD